MLIKAYAQNWNPNIINWCSRGRNNAASLMGQVKVKTKWHNINFWNTKVIYVLYDNYKCTYVGKALDRGFGIRLKEHLSDRLSNRWDTFSFYSLSTINVTTGETRAPGTRQISSETMINSLEAISILIADPSLNRKRESLKDALEIYQLQGTEDESKESYQQDIIARLDEIERLLLHLK